jgi:hypothetical protein
MRNQKFLGVLSAIGLALFATSASASTVFGSKLNHEPTPAESCNQNKAADMCSWVLTIAQQNVGHERAPKNGTVIKLRLRSCVPGSFILQIAHAIPNSRRAQVVRTGPAINYRGNPSNCNGGTTFIETFNVNVPVRTGDYLAVIATKVGFIYNASGDGTLVFDPPLVDGGPLRTAGSTSLGSGILLLQAQYND